jgi:hypothetical protein
MTASPQPSKLPEDKVKSLTSLKNPLTNPTFYGLFGLLLLYILLNQTPNRGGFDWYFAFRAAARNEASIIITPYWVNFLSFLPAHLPEPLGFSLWISAGCLAVYTAARSSKAPVFALLLSYQLHWCLYHGQVDTYLAGAAALGLWASQKQKPYLGGAAILTLLIKPHIGLLPALLIFWWLKEKKKAAIVILSGMAVSFLAWPGWLESLVTTQAFSYTQRLPVATWNNISPHLPFYISLPLVAAALLSPLEKPRKLQALLAVSLLVSPYSPVYSQVILLWLPLPIPIALLACLPWIGAVIFNGVYYQAAGLVLPITILVYDFWPLIITKWEMAAKSTRVEPT